MDFSLLDDDELVEVTNRGEVDAFAEIVARYKDKMITLVYRYVYDLETAEDLAQEVFLRVFRAMRTYKKKAKFKTWLFTIAMNLAKDELKRRARHPVTLSQGNSYQQKDPTERLSLSDSINSALSKLQGDEREVLILREIQGLNYDEIAELTLVPLGTVRSRLARARLHFKEVYKRNYEL